MSFVAAFLQIVWLDWYYYYCHAESKSWKLSVKECFWCEGRVAVIDNNPPLSLLPNISTEARARNVPVLTSHCKQNK